jgi:hypothetical protein
VRLSTESIILMHQRITDQISLDLNGAYANWRFCDYSSCYELLAMIANNNDAYNS